MVMAVISIILSLLCGVALFLYGMGLMGDGLKKVAGNSLEETLYKLTSTPIKGVLLGAGVTAIIQSSSATTVMVIGFVNSGMMKVAQAIGVIMGANIGTSITGWILCLSYIEGGSGIAKLLSTSTISAIVAIAGILLQKVSKKSKYHHIGDIMLGFAILMVGMQTMSSAVSPLKESETFIRTLTMFTNPILGILIGIVFTAILQSASASIGILQALSMTGAITFSSAFPIVLGIGIGASCPVLISSLSTNNNGKRTALVYLVNDLLGCIIWGTIFYVVNAFAHFPFMNVVMQPVSIAALNTIYRVLTITVLMPFISKIEKLVFMLIKDSAEDLEEQADFDLLEERFLDYPGLAISQCRKAVNGMAKTTRKNVLRSIRQLDEYTEKRAAKIAKKEELLDKYEDKLGTYIMKLTKKEMNTSQSKIVTEFLHSLTDLERIGDYACHIDATAAELVEKDIHFSERAAYEMKVLRAANEQIVIMTMEAFKADDAIKALQIEPLRQCIEGMCGQMKVNHVQRLQDGVCSITQGFAFNDLLTSFERIAGHCSNLAIAVIEASTDNWMSHQDLSDRKHNDESYTACLEQYRKLYSLEGQEAESTVLNITARAEKEMAEEDGTDKK